MADSTDIKFGRRRNIMNTAEQMRVDLLGYLQSNGHNDVNVDYFNEEEISFFHKCFELLNNTSYDLINSDSIFSNEGNWREQSFVFGKEYCSGKISMTSLSTHEVLASILKWGKVFHDMVLLDVKAAFPLLIYNIATDIPKFISHIKVLHTRAEQCVYFQISILSSNNPNNAVCFDDLRNFSFSVTDTYCCPYVSKKSKCIFQSNNDTNHECSKSLDNYNDELVGLLSQLEKNGIINIDRISKSIFMI